MPRGGTAGPQLLRGAHRWGRGDSRSQENTLMAESAVKRPPRRAVMRNGSLCGR